MRRNWSVAQTRSNMAGTAATALLAQRFEVYDPKFSERCRGGWRRVQLFANYLLIAGVAGRERAVSGTKGILRILPGLLPMSFVAELRGRENCHGVVVLPVRPKFESGSSVRYTPLGLDVIFVSQSARDRAIVMLSLLGKRQKIEVSEAELVAA